MATARRLNTIAFVLLLCIPGCAREPGPEAEADVMATLESFYGAMKKGDKTAAMALIAPEALFVEGGKLETRAEYEANHLPLDIEFESQTTGKRTPVRVTLQGNTAWVIASTDYDEVAVPFTSMQLAVLTHENDRWLIRSIHWSSRRK